MLSDGDDVNASQFVYASEDVAIRGWVDQRTRAAVDQEGAFRHPGGIGFREPEDGVADSLLVYLDEAAIRRLALVVEDMVAALDQAHDMADERRAEPGRDALPFGGNVALALLAIAVVGLVVLVVVRMTT